MTNEELWAQSHPSICSLSFLANGERLSSGSGFLVDGFLITNNHVFQVPPASEVVLQFVESDGHAPSATVRISMADFQAELRDGEPETSWDFAIFNNAWPEFASIPSIDLADPDWTPTIGESVCMLGYHFDQQNLAFHSGVLSSTYTRAGVGYLQVDGSVNSGNSGGPLLSAESGEVIGIVTRRATGLTAQFDQLIASFAENIEVLKAVQGGMSLGGVDPMEMLAISQRQMAIVSQEMKRSANVGIGYAYTLDKIRSSLSAL